MKRKCEFRDKSKYNYSILMPYMGRHIWIDYVAQSDGTYIVIDDTYRAKMLRSTVADILRHFRHDKGIEIFRQRRGQELTMRKVLYKYTITTPNMIDEFVPDRFGVRYHDCYFSRQSDGSWSNSCGGHPFTRREMAAMVCEYRHHNYNDIVFQRERFSWD